MYWFDTRIDTRKITKRVSIRINIKHHLYINLYGGPGKRCSVAAALRSEGPPERRGERRTSPSCHSRPQRPRPQHAARRTSKTYKYTYSN